MVDIPLDEAFGWAVAVILAYPALTLILSEWSRRVPERGSPLQDFLNMARFLLLPAAAGWVVINKLAKLPPEGLAVRIIDTAFGVALLFTIYVAAKGIVAVAAERTRAPRLLFDIALTVLVSLGAASIIATVWDFSMASLLSAVGVGSLVMGLALQSVIGGMVNGLLVLSGKHFRIGDYVNVGGKAGRVTQIDWQSVALQTSPSEKLVLPSATLASGTFSVTDGQKPAKLPLTVTLSCEYAPEAVRAMLLETARAALHLAAEGTTCRVNEITPEGVVYTVTLAVAEREKVDAARDEFLSRLWYVAQRHGVSISGDRQAGNLIHEAETPEERAALLAQSGAFGRPVEALLDLAAAGQLQRWRTGETILRQGDRAQTTMVLLRGAVGVATEINAVRIELERLRAGQLFAIREAFRAMPSPMTVTALEDCEIMAFAADAMQQLFNRDPELAADIEKLLEARAKALKSLTAAEGRDRAASGARRKPTLVA
jgi:small-conductance mechanosensitive channel